MLLPPFDQKSRFYRGNLHGHSTHSDGMLSSQDVIEAYRGGGYDFTCLSDHLWHDPRFAAKTVNDTSALDRDDFITITSAEMHCLGKKYAADHLWHLVANGLPADFEMASKNETATHMIARAQDAGAYVSLAHPEWYSLTEEEAMLASEVDAVEVYNHSCVICAARGSGVATIDLLLNENKRVLINATDDSHFRTDDIGGGWVMVAADMLTPATLIAALKQGHNYSSTGADITSLSIENKTLHVETSEASAIIVSGGGHEALFVNGEKLTEATFDLAQLKSPYFRVTVITADRLQAWSNPYWIDRIF